MSLINCIWRQCLFAISILNGTLQVTYQDAVYNVAVGISIPCCEFPHQWVEFKCAVVSNSAMVTINGHTRRVFVVRSPTLLQHDVMSTSDVSASHNFVDVQNTRRVSLQNSVVVVRRDTTRSAPLTRRHSDVTASRAKVFCLRCRHLICRRTTVGNTSAPQLPLCPLQM